MAFSSYFGIFAVFFFVALYLQVVGSRSPYLTALDFVPMAVGMIVASALTGRWVARVGPRTPMADRLSPGRVGLVLTDLLLSPDAGLSTIGWTLFMTGSGFGVALVPVTSASLAVIPPEHSGMAASTTNTSRELGAVVGVAVLGSVVTGQLTTNLVHRLAAIGIPPQFRVRSRDGGHDGKCLRAGLGGEQESRHRLDRPPRGAGRVRCLLPRPYDLAHDRGGAHACGERPLAS